MSILQANTEDFCIMQTVRTEDGMSGYHTVWQDAEHFAACAVQRMPDNRTNAEEAAQKPDMKRSYHILTARGTDLPFHAIVKRVSDGRIFRLTSDSADLKTPIGSRLNLQVYLAEEWSLT